MYTLINTLAYDLAISYCFCRLLFWMLPVKPRRPWLLAILCWCVMALTPILAAWHPLILIAIMAITLRGAEPLCRQRLIKASTSMYIVMVLSLLVHAILTLSIPGFATSIYKDFAINIVIIPACTLCTRRAMNKPLPVLSRTESALLLLAELMLFLFYGFVPMLLGVTNFKMAALFNLFLLGIGSILLFGFYRILRLRAANRLQAQQNAELAKLQEEYIVFRHTHKYHLEELMPLAEAKDMDGIEDYLVSNIVPLWKESSITLDPDKMAAVRDVQLRNSIAAIAKRAGSIVGITVNVEVAGEVDIPSHLSRSVHDLVHIYASNAVQYLSLFGGTLGLELYGRPGFACITIRNTLQPDFNPKRLHPRKTLGRHGNGIRIAKDIAKLHPDLTLSTKLNRRDGIANELSQRITVLSAEYKGGIAHEPATTQD